MQQHVGAMWCEAGERETEVGSTTAQSIWLTPAYGSYYYIIEATCGIASTW